MDALRRLCGEIFGIERRQADGGVGGGMPALAAPAAPVQNGILMTNDFVIKLIDGNAAVEEVLRMIANQPGRFSFEPGDVERSEPHIWRPRRPLRALVR